MTEEQMNALQYSAEMIMEAIKQHFANVGHNLPVDVMERIDGDLGVIENAIDDIFIEVRRTL